MALQSISWERPPNTKLRFVPARSDLVPLLRQSALVRVPITQYFVGGVKWGGPYSATFDGANIWVTNSSGGVSKVDIVTNTEVATLLAGSGSGASIFDGTHLWVANVMDDSVAVIDVATNLVVANVPTGDAPVALAFDGQNVWVANMGGSLSIIRRSSRAVVTNIVMPDSPMSLAFDGTYIWVGSWYSNYVYAIYRRTNSIWGSIFVGQRSSEIVWDGRHLWVSLENGDIRKIDIEDWRIVATVWVGRWPRGMAFDGKQLWIAVVDDPLSTLIRLDTVTNEILGVVGVGYIPTGVAFDGTHVWATTLFDREVCKVPAFPIGR